MNHLDVLIIGAGLSGIGAASHLERDQPGTSYAVIERRDAIGGTWDLFRYPGVRSDSDMHTLGYRLRPWDDEQVLADGPSIKAYVEETAAEFGVVGKIRFGHRAVRYAWDSHQQVWTVDLETDEGHQQLTCGFLWNCTGYYDYDHPYAADLPGLESFGGRVVHPQSWPDDLDYAGKRVVVIGSGATAVTLLPAMADLAANVTMLQRTPSYVVSVPQRDSAAARLGRVLPRSVAASVVRWRNILVQWGLFQLARRRPAFVRTAIRGATRRALPEGYEVDTHFNPPYDPWDQRMCIVPDGDLFRAIRRGSASVVTGRIETFTPEGIRLTDGTEVAADIVVTATGLSLLAFGGAEILVDGELVDLGSRIAYRGVMLDGVPNFAYVVGYANASWTLKADLVSAYVVGLLRHMARHRFQVVVPELDSDVGSAPLIDLTSGYVQRALDTFPKQGDRGPWKAPHNYLRDAVMLRFRPRAERALRFHPQGWNDQPAGLPTLEPNLLKGGHHGYR
ncbi:FAD-containing monooxygenase EthA [metagenome]|uniref:FAD-containing monooxygenase EthA n=1 Tax=metagenome TaxID=256318 RepID=A0A2P2BYW4_9ZZZZ